MTAEDPAVNEAVSEQEHRRAAGSEPPIVEARSVLRTRFFSVTFHQIYSTLNLLSFFPDLFSFKDVYLVVDCN